MPKTHLSFVPSNYLFPTVLRRTALRQTTLAHAVLFFIVILSCTYAQAEPTKDTEQLAVQPPIQTPTQSSSPWGGASLTATIYNPQKVVYDVHVKTVGEVESVLDRASHLSVITGADPFEQSIVLVLHGPELSFFAIENYKKHKELMHRAQSLVESEVLKIKMCAIAAQSQGYSPKDIHGFVEMVPMGDAEIIRLQYEEDHAYMQ